jgi:hypothetical protein
MGRVKQASGDGTSSKTKGKNGKFEIRMSKFETNSKLKKAENARFAD